ncbi:MAG: DUF4336 domain-containing protein [Pseudomonadota bacterium]
MTALKKIDDGLWVVDAPMVFCGLHIGTRMTVVRLPDGGLWLHSPIDAAPDLVAEITALGPVRFIVAPNLWHHLFVASWQAVAPDAKTYVASGLLKKRPALHADEVLADVAPAEWADTLDQVVIKGMPKIGEVVFHHRPSRTLLLTDLAFNFQHERPWFTRTMTRLLGQVGTLAPTVFERLLTRDRDALAASLEAVLSLPFERVVVTHGDIVERGGREQLSAGYQWALRSRATA